MGMNHKVNSLLKKLVTIFLDDDGAVLAKPKQTFRLTQNAFKKLLLIFFFYKLILQNFLLTD